MIDTKTYLDFIRTALETDGIQVADKANKIALDEKRITTAQYSAAARIIVKAYIAQEEETTE